VLPGPHVAQSAVGPNRQAGDAMDSAGAATTQGVLNALAAYQRTLAPPVTRFDAWARGQQSALSAQEQRGFALFVGKARCALCHRTWRFTDDGLHDIGLPLDHAEPQRQFKTPPLRAIALTAPYMHDGRFAGLARVVEHYNDGAIERPTLSPNLQARLNLSPAETAALTAFLRTL